MKTDLFPNLQKQAGPCCVCCGVGLGYSNPRQYCRKLWCDAEPEPHLSDDEIAAALKIAKRLAYHQGKKKAHRLAVAFKPVP